MLKSFTVNETKKNDNVTEQIGVAAMIWIRNLEVLGSSFCCNTGYHN
jgi:hypothetical protein